MNPQEYIDQAVSRLESEGNEVSQISLESGPATAAFRSVFRTRWLTKFDLFTVLAGCPDASEPTISTLASEALEYAIRNRSRLFGMRNATALTVFPVLVASNVNDDAKSYALARPAKLAGAFTFPAIVDLAGNETYSYTGKVVWGSLYAKWQREQLSSTLGPPMRSKP